VASAEFRLALPQMPRAGARGASLSKIVCGGAFMPIVNLTEDELTKLWEAVNSGAMPGVLSARARCEHGSANLHSRNCQTVRQLAFKIGGKSFN